MPLLVANIKISSTSREIGAGAVLPKSLPTIAKYVDITAGRQSTFKSNGGRGGSGAPHKIMLIF